jgi:hypothetical protein
MATLSKIATFCTVLVLTRLEGRFLQYSGIPGMFSGGGLASALWSFDRPTSSTSLPQMAFLASLLLLVAVMNGGNGVGALTGAWRSTSAITSA